MKSLFIMKKTLIILAILFILSLFFINSKFNIWKKEDHPLLNAPSSNLIGTDYDE